MWEQAIITQIKSTLWAERGWDPDLKSDLELT